jgi:hypothetical protein
MPRIPGMQSSLEDGQVYLARVGQTYHIHPSAMLYNFHPVASLSSFLPKVRKVQQALLSMAHHGRHGRQKSDQILWRENATPKKSHLKHRQYSQMTL